MVLIKMEKSLNQLFMVERMMKGKKKKMMNIQEVKEKKMMIFQEKILKEMKMTRAEKTISPSPMIRMRSLKIWRALRMTGQK